MSETNKEICERWLKMTNANSRIYNMEYENKKKTLKDKLLDELLPKIEEEPDYTFYEYNTVYPLYSGTNPIVEEKKENNGQIRIIPSISQ